VHSDFPNADLHKVFAYKIKRVQACIDARGREVVSMLASGTQDRGFAFGRSRRIFRAKKSSACLHSEGKSSSLPHVADLRHVKETYNLLWKSQIIGKIVRKFLALFCSSLTVVSGVA
jgi:hypothetical protein